MADTAAQFADHPALKRPKVTEREPLHWNQLKFGETAPSVSELALKDINLADPELWRQGRIGIALPVCAEKIRCIGQKRASLAGSGH